MGREFIPCVVIYQNVTLGLNMKNNQLKKECFLFAFIIILQKHQRKY